MNPFEDAAENAGGGYITDEGTYAVQIAKVEDGSWSSGAPYAEVTFQDVQGRTLRDRVWYDGNHDHADIGKGLWRIAGLFKVARAQFPQDGEFDTADHYRISEKALERLVGCVLEIVVIKEPARDDPEKSYARAKYHNFYDGPPLTFPKLEEEAAPAAAAASGGNTAAARDEDIPF